MTNVADKTTTNPTDEKLGKFARQQHHLFEMVKKGALPTEELGALFQLIVDGKLPNWGGLVNGTYELTIAKLLQEIGVVVIPATTSKFVAKNNFRLKKDGGICSQTGVNFQDWFGDKVENPISEQILRYAKLCQTSPDGLIIAELGGEAKAETTLMELFFLMEEQKNGESGPLLVNDRANIFYVKDVADALRTVSVHWGDDGWRVYAHSVGCPIRWSVGDQVFSRNSGSLKPSAPAQV